MHFSLCFYLMRIVWLSDMSEKADEFQCGTHKLYCVWFGYFYILFFFSSSFISDLRYHRNNVTNGMMWSSLLNLCEQGSSRFNKRECLSEFNFKTFLLLLSITFPFIKSCFSFTSDYGCGSNICSLLLMFLDWWSENIVVSHIYFWDY